MAPSEPPLAEIEERIRTAIQTVRVNIRWKLGKDVQYLTTRIHYGHLPKSATLADYEAIISLIVHDELAIVYRYVWGEAIYPTVVSNYLGRTWLVMFGLNGVMETAFPPSDPDTYLADPRFQYLGKMHELMR